MKSMSRRAAFATLFGGLGAGAATVALGQHRMRVHTATERAPLRLVSASQGISGNRVSITVRGGTRVIRSNGVPDHKVGRFPNGGNPHRIAAQSHRFVVPAAPSKGSRARDVGRNLTGVAINGVPFDPGAAEFWRGDRRSGWQYEALGGAVALGLDANYAHVQPNGAYHYHGLPIGLMQTLGWSKSRPSPLIGYAIDGFPIYAITAEIDGRVVEMTSSYRLRAGTRPGGSHPSGRYDGTFVQDYVYREGAGRLDAANGAFVETAEYPGGTYAYFLTTSYPVLPRLYYGAPGEGFTKRRR